MPWPARSSASAGGIRFPLKPGKSWSFLLATITAKISSQPEAAPTPRSVTGARSLFWLVFLFTGLAFLQLGLVNNDLKPLTFLPLIVLAGCSGVVIFLFQHWPEWRQAGDPILLPLTFFLSGLGLVLVARLAPAF